MEHVQNILNEQLLIRYLIDDNDSIYALWTGDLQLVPDMLQNDMCRGILTVILHLFEKGKAYDYPSLKHELECLEEDAECFENQALDKIRSMKMPLSLDMPSVIQTITESWKRQQYEKAAVALLDGVSRGQHELNSTLEEAMNTIDRFKNPGNRELEESISSVAHAVANTIADAHQRGTVNHLTGFRDLDALVPLYIPGNMALIGGITGSGKTSFLMSLMSHLAADIPCLFISFEMTKEQAMIKLLSIRTEVPYSKILTGNLNDTQYINLLKDLDALQKQPLHLLDGRDVSLGKLRKQLEALRAQHTYFVCFIDGLQPFLMNNPFSKDKEWLAIELKRWVNDLGITVCITTQISDVYRVESRPTLFDFAKCHGFEKVSDQVFALVPSGQTDNGRFAEVTLKTLKNRLGVKPSIMLAVLTEFGKIENYLPVVEEE